MDYDTKLTRLEHLKELVDRYRSSPGTDEARKLHQEICEIYGEVADAFAEVVGKQKIEVRGRGGVSIYPNYFEAGYFSGRTFHTHQGYTELLKVIGTIKTRISEMKISPTPNGKGHRVFLVHGHQESALQSCARFIEKLGLPLTVLREEPNQGRTIIEKFIDYSDVGFAIVLLTADDRGGTADKPYDEQLPRARQNVVFELGFFIGKLGRERVCALYEQGVELPSDYRGSGFYSVGQSIRMANGVSQRAAGGWPPSGSEQSNFTGDR